MCTCEFSLNMVYVKSQDAQVWDRVPIKSLDQKDYRGYVSPLRYQHTTRQGGILVEINISLFSKALGAFSNPKTVVVTFSAAQCTRIRTQLRLIRTRYE